MRQSLIKVMLLLGVALSALAQTATPPDFSGTWVLNIAKSTLSKDDSVKSEIITIDYKKSAINFHYKTDGKKSNETYTPDGQKRVIKDMKSGQLVSKATWQDSVLLIESTLEIKIPNVVVSVSGLKPVIDKWALTSDGRTLTHEMEDPKEVFVYDKQ